MTKKLRDSFLPVVTKVEVFTLRISTSLSCSDVFGSNDDAAAALISSSLPFRKCLGRKPVSAGERSLVQLAARTNHFRETGNKRTRRKVEEVHGHMRRGVENGCPSSPMDQSSKTSDGALKALISISLLIFRVAFVVYSHSSFHRSCCVFYNRLIMSY